MTKAACFLLTLLVWASQANSQSNADVNCDDPVTCAEVAAERVIELDRRFGSVLAQLRDKLAEQEEIIAEMQRSFDERVDAALRRPMVPLNTVAFFARSECPQGWRKFSTANGRYVVAAHQGSDVPITIGEALQRNENRAVANHTHKTKSKVFTGGEDGQAKWNGDIRRKIVETGNPIVGDNETTASGTNAPYITLLACIYR